MKKILEKTMVKMTPGMGALLVDRIRVGQKGEEGEARSLLRVLPSLRKLLRAPPNLLLPLQVRVNLLETQCRLTQQPGGGQTVPVPR